TGRGDPAGRVVPRGHVGRPAVHLHAVTVRKCHDRAPERAGLDARPFSFRPRPPATSTKEAVEYDASSEASHRIARATSIALPPRFIGSVGPRRATRPGSPPSA